MSSIEVLYQLKNSFDYIVASPTEILANGFPYDNIIGLLFEEKISYEQICSEYVNFFQNKNGILQSASIAVIKTSELKEFARIISTIIDEKHMDFNIDSAFQYERGNNYCIFDLGEYISCVTNKNLRDKAISKFKEMIPIYRHTEYFYNTIPLEKSSGVSIYIPNYKSSYDKIEDFYKQLLWSNESNFNNVYYDNISSFL